MCNWVFEFTGKPFALVPCSWHYNWSVKINSSFRTYITCSTKYTSYHMLSLFISWQINIIKISLSKTFFRCAKVQNKLAYLYKLIHRTKGSLVTYLISNHSRILNLPINMWGTLSLFFVWPAEYEIPLNFFLCPLNM